MSREEELEQLSRRNAEIFKEVVRRQNEQIEQQQLKIDGLITTQSTIMRQMDILEERLSRIQIQIMGTKATV